MKDGHDLDQKLKRWSGPVQSGVAVLILIIGYFFVYPALIIYFGFGTTVLENLPGWAEVAIEDSYQPIGWIEERSHLYKGYIAWLMETLVQ